MEHSLIIWKMLVLIFQKLKTIKLKAILQQNEINFWLFRWFIFSKLIKLNGIFYFHFYINALNRLSIQTRILKYSVFQKKIYNFAIKFNHFSFKSSKILTAF